MERVIGFIGAGNMGGALLGGLAREGLAEYSASV
ncbi:MAG: NAD(P)-binding domain-containing protein [Clostridia bacterium]